MDISVVIPLYNEEESLTELYNWIAKVMAANNYSYEVIFVDDGSTDTSWTVMSELAQAHPEVKGIRFRRNHGKSAGLNVGFVAKHILVLSTTHGDPQSSPHNIPETLATIVPPRFDLPRGWNKKPHDPLTKTIPTQSYIGATRKMSNIAH